MCLSLQSLPLRSPDVRLTLLPSTTLWSSETPAPPQTLPEASQPLTLWKAKEHRWWETGMGVKGSPAGCRVSTLPRGVVPPRAHQQCSASTAAGCAPGSKILPRTSDSRQVETGSSSLTPSPHVGPRDTSTITTTSTTITTTITTTPHKHICIHYGGLNATQQVLESPHLHYKALLSHVNRL